MKEFIKAISVVLWVLVLPVLAESSRPNVVFFLVDDLGWGDVGCYDSVYHETPNLDRLRDEGMKFNQAYAACAVCSPSRAAILTGRYPARLHLTDWIAGHRRPKAKLAVPDWQMYIDQERITLAEALQDAGYRTQFIGKWHLIPYRLKDIKDKHYPESHGFDHNIAGREWGQPKGPGRYFHPFGMPNLEGEEGEYLTDALTDEAVRFIEKVDKEKPFLLYFAYYTVHGPIMAKESYKQKYADKKKHNEHDNIDSRQAAAYAGMIQSLDESVGRVLKTLEKQGLEKDTMVVFTSDNGGVIGRANNGPFRKGKGTPYEGGIREPLLVKWPGVVKPGSVCETPVIGTDFYPTILEMAGLPPRPTEHVDGVSLAPLLKQTGEIDRDTLYWHYPHYHIAKPNGIIRHGDLKLIEFFEDRRLELYDLAADPGETTDLVQKRPADVRRLHAMLKKWRNDVGAQMMTPNPNYTASD